MVSVVVTVKNEEFSIKELLSSLNRQKGLDELVIVDGGSKDKTVMIIDSFKSKAKFPINLIIEPRANIARGRNIAIAAAKGDIIAVTDAGCEVGSGWLEALTRPLKEQEKSRVVAGFFKAYRGRFAHNVLSAVTIPSLGEVRTWKFLPSSRSIAFRKDAWEKVAKYPEWLPICEDVVFDLTLKRRGIDLHFAPDAWVTWFVRNSWKDYFWQYYRYARGDGHAKLWPRRHLIRYATYASGVILTYLTVQISLLFLIPLLAGFVVYMSKFWGRFLYHYPKETLLTNVLAFLTIPFLVIEGDVAKMVGYPVGVWQRMTGKIRFEQY
jgi:glycosyltransferase involved in cell wall biosynthesis